MSSPFLSIALIVKNEKDNLPSLFNSLKIIRERMNVEVVVVDTGSEDNTVEICEKENCRIFNFKWIDDFSAARNESLKHCRGKWIFWLDADDVLSENASYWFVQYLSQLADNRCYSFTVFSPDGKGGGNRFEQIRLIPNGKDLYFSNPIHESLALSINNLEIPVTKTSQLIRHMGYADSQSLENKKKRNQNILEGMRAKGDIPIALLFSLARTYQVDGQYAQALDAFQTIIETENANELHKDVYLAAVLYLGQTLAFINKVDEAQLWFQKNLELGQNHPQFLFEFGKVLYVMGNSQEAREVFTAAKNLKAVDWTIPTDWDSIFNGIDELLSRLNTSHPAGSSVKHSSFQMQPNPEDKGNDIEKSGPLRVPETHLERDNKPSAEVKTQSSSESAAKRDQVAAENFTSQKTLNSAKNNAEAGWTLPKYGADRHAEINREAGQKSSPQKKLDTSVAGMDGLPTDINEMFGKIREPLKIPHPKNTLSVVMIVKNESSNIKEAVESFLPFADEIIINDTGSTDGTQNILDTLPVKWFQTEWQKDFSLARNQCLEKASSSWILWMDADDRVPQDQIENFKKLKTGQLDRIFGFQVINTQGGMALGTRFMQIRMFPNHPEIKFERKIHEQMVFSAARLGLHCFYTETTIHHTGYESVETKKQKAKRNLEMAKGDEHLKGVDPTYTMSLGDSHYILEEWDKGIQFYKLAFEIPDLETKNKDVYGILPSYIGMGYEKLQQYEMALPWLDKAIKLIPEKLEPHYHKAICLKGLGRGSEAAELFQKILEMPLVHSSTGNQYDVIKIYSFHHLSEWLIENKNFKLAITLLDKMHLTYPQVAESWISLGICHHQMNHKDMAIDAWKKALELNPKIASNILPLLNKLLKESGRSGEIQNLEPSLKSSNTFNSLPVSLCMIVKNEEVNLNNCLNSVKGLFEETIIVDTGSTDNTLSVIKKHGANLLEEPWENDFSKARNKSLEKATCPWIFWMDADDILLPDDVSKIRELVTNRKPEEAFSFLIQNSQDQGNTGSLFNQIRLFPNRREIRFSFPVHEQVMPSLEKAKIPVQFTDIKVIHTGYEDKEAAKQKQIRNRDLLEHQIESGQNVTAVTYYTLAHAYLDLGENEKAVDFFLDAVEFAEKTGTNSHILEIGPAKTATALANLGRYEEALNIIQVGLEKWDPPHPETILLKAQIEEKIGNKKSAGDWYSRLLGFEEQPTFIPVDYQLLKIKALEYLGKYWYDQGKKELAVELLQSGIGIKSGESFNSSSLREKYQKYGIQQL